MSTLIISLLSACAGIILAWSLRRPVRRLTGAGPAFCLWLLPPLLAAVAWLPAWNTAAPREIASMLVLPQLLAGPQSWATSTGADTSFARILLYLWLTGCGVMLTRLALHCLQIARQSQPLTDTIRTAIQPYTKHLDANAIRLRPAGPAVCWLPGCRLLLPADLLQRFDDDQRALVMAHECMHVDRLDPVWSLIAELMLAALWFFPPAWIAMSRFRLDQELACDAAIINRSPRHAARYARALLSGATTPRTLAVTTPWLTQPQLKERLTMIQSHSCSSRKRHACYAILIPLLAGTALAAHATMPGPSAHDAMQSPAASSSASVIIASRLHHRPLYPPEAFENHEEGTVVLKVHVNAQGQPTEVVIDPETTHASQAFITAAIKAAKQWSYTPGRVDGQVQAGWVRIPVAFRLSAPEAARQTSTNASGKH